MEIAILAILGGFSAPLMVSNGSGNYIVLFSYLMLLDGGMLVLSYYKKWRAVNNCRIRIYHGPFGRLVDFSIG